MDDDASALLREARAVCETVATTLGPSGVNKLVIEGDGTVTLTAAGGAALERLELDAPAAELLRAAATGFRDRHGDGATTVVALTGALLEEAAELRAMGLHPTSVERGYRLALDVAGERARAVAVPLDSVEPAAVARTALTDVRDAGVRDNVAARVADAAATVRRARGDGAFDRRDLAVVTRVGGSMADTELVRGVVLDASPVEPDMPRSAEGGIALLSSTVDVPRLGSATSRGAALDLSMAPESFEERREIGERERARFDAVLGAAVDAGCTVLLSTNAVNDRVKRTIANRGLVAIQRVDEAAFRRLARATGGTVVSGLADVAGSTLGEGTVEVRRVAGRDVTVVHAAGAEPVYTLFCRSPDPRSLEEFSRSVEAAVAAVAAADRAGSVVPGGGAVEVAAAAAVRDAVPAVEGREQLAAAAFADALEVVPRTLARSAGLDVTSATVELRAAHAAGRDSTGVDAVLGVLGDALDEDSVVEPTGWKLDVWEAATDLASRLVRIDERLPAGDLSDDEDGAESDPPAEGP